MRIFLAPLGTGEVTVGGDEHHYLAHVRRARAGDRIEVVDGNGHCAAAEILAIGDGETRLRIGHVAAVALELPRLRALIPVIKGDRMDTCIEKLVEVGVDEIVVWPASRAVVKLEGERRVSRVAHYQGIAQAAARQSGRATVPDLAWAESLSRAIGNLPPSSSRLVLDPGADPMKLADLQASGAAVDDVTIASGPEGGLSAAELELLLASGFRGIGLGPQILRAETAPVIAVALLRAALRR
jgi:16S rRNA (uracil1498-N3)-methyltransferase